MVTLKAATYQVTTTFKDNVYAEGLEELQEYGLAIMLYGYSDKDHLEVDTTKTAGTVTKTIKIARTGAYWINPVLAPTDALWSVDMVALRPSPRPRHRRSPAPPRWARRSRPRRAPGSRPGRS